MVSLVYTKLSLTITQTLLSAAPDVLHHQHILVILIESEWFGIKHVCSRN